MNWAIFLRADNGRHGCRYMKDPVVNVPGRLVDIISGTQSEAIAYCEKLDKEKAAATA